MNERDLRLAEYPGFDLSTIRGATIMVVGVGALGNEVLKNLALLGIGKIIIIDYDSIEPSNLTRSVLFRESDVGAPKVEVAAKALSQIEPRSKILPLHADIRGGVGLGVFRRVDIVLGCLDNREARLDLNKFCRLSNVPYVDGSLGGNIPFYGGVRIFLPSKGACYGCTLSDLEFWTISQKFPCGGPKNNNSGTNVPQSTSSIEASIIAAMQVQEALKLLHRQEVEGGVGYFYSGVTFSISKVKYEEKANCQSHEKPINGSIVQIHQDLATLTPNSMLRLVRQRYGEKAALLFPGNIVRNTTCPNGHKQLEVFKLDVSMGDENTICQECHQPLEINRVWIMTQEDTFGYASFEDMGIPNLAVFTVENEMGEIFVEVGSDFVK